jgi:hypothetical protein
MLEPLMATIISQAPWARHAGRRLVVKLPPIVVRYCSALRAMQRASWWRRAALELDVWSALRTPCGE